MSPRPWTRLTHDEIGYGADYTPEQWSPEVWAEDVALMREAGVSFVNLAVFAWGLIEPEPGRFEFGLFDQVMDLLHENGIAVDLANATASPPAWLDAAHPEIRPMDADGVRLGFGSRQSWCPSSPIYREHALRLTRAVAEHYADHPALALWHVNNEYGCHNARCYCDVSAAHFRTWLQDRYGTLDRLNEAWGTAFWSQHYSDWEQIGTPRRATTFLNPTQCLDFERFSSDALLQCYLAEVEVLREVTPEVACSTNFMVHGSRGMDYLRWGPQMDVVTNNHYLDEASETPECELALAADLVRGCAGGAPWILTEASTSAVNWGNVNRAKHPGEMWRNTLSHVARGADAISYFQWRASKAGAEKYHSALVPHAGPDSRLFREVVEQGAHLRALSEVAGSVADNDVALLVDWRARWASELDAHPHNEFDYRAALMDWYAPLWDAGIQADLVGVETDLSRYRLVVVAGLYLVDDATRDAIQAAVQGGTHVLIGYFSGIVDEHDHVRLGGYPGAFTDLLGVRVEEFSPLRAGVEVGLSDSSSATTWSEDLSIVDPVTRAVLTYTSGDHAGAPAVTCRDIGDARAWYCSARLSGTARARLLAKVCTAAEVEPVAPAVGLELAARHSDDHRYVFAINHGEQARPLPCEGTDLLTGHTAAVHLVPAGGTAVVRGSRVDA